MTPRDTERIKQAAENEYPFASEKHGHLLSHQKIEFNKQAEMFRTSHRAGATAEAQHWTSIVAAKDLAIKELAEGLENISHVLSGVVNKIYEGVVIPNEVPTIKAAKQLIAKHKQL